MDEIKTYIAADCRFFDRAAARKTGMSVDRFNKKVVEKINQTVGSEDNYIVFMGEITNDDFESNKELFSKVIGKKSIIDSAKQTQFTEEQWKEMGFIHVWNNNGADKVTINGEDTFIVLEAVDEFYKRDKQNKTLYLAVPGSMSGQKELYKDRQLNISMDQWDYVPIEMGTRLPQIFDDQEVFSRMEDIK